MHISAQNEITVNLKEAHAIGDELHLDFIVENKGADALVGATFRDTKLYDNQGNVYDVKRIKFGQKEITYGGVDQQCIQGIPMKLKLIFKGAPSKLLLVKALMFKLYTRADNKEFPKRFNSIIVPTSTSKLVNEALADSLFLEVAPKVFARITGVSRNENEVFINMIVLNTASDRDMSFSFRDTRIIDNIGNSVNIKEIDFAGKKATYGSATAMMPQAVPMKLSFKFILTDPSAKKINIFEFTSAGIKFQLHNLSLSGLLVH